MANQISIVIPFEAIIDIDYGIIKSIKSIYKESDMFDYSIYEFTDNQIVYLLLNRIRENPLCLVCKENEDEVLKDIIDNHYKTVLKNSRLTDIVNILIGANNFNMVSISIFCKNKLEEQVVRQKLSHLVNLRFIIADSIKDISYDRHQAIFIPKLSLLKEIADIVPETIKFYIFKARYNLEITDEGYVIPMESIENIELFRLTIATPYKMDKSYFITED